MLSYFTTFGVQSPWMLTALTLLVIPVLIHIISKGRVQLVKFANTKLIKAAKPKKMRHLLLTEPWLLLLRLLLLIVAILLLAKVLFLKPLPTPNQVTLVTSQWLNESNEREKSQLLALAKGAPIYLLASRTSLLSEHDISQWQQKNLSAAQSVGNNQSGNVNSVANIRLNLAYFLAEADPKTVVDVFVTNSATQFISSVSFPELENHLINWHIKPSPYSAVQQYLESIKLVIVYDQDRADDIKYFKPALAAIQQLSAPKLSVKSFLNQQLLTNILYQQTLAEKPNWIFYLSSQQPDNFLITALANGANIVIDAKNTEENLTALPIITVRPNSESLLSEGMMFYQRARPLNIFKSLNISDEEKVEKVLLHFTEKNVTEQNVVNLPMLIRSEINWQNLEVNNQRSYVYQLYSRFSPSWGTLLTTKHLPIFLQNLLLGHWQKGNAERQYLLSEAQIRDLTESQLSQVIADDSSDVSADPQRNAKTVDNLLSAETMESTGTHALNKLPNLATVIKQQQRIANDSQQILAILLVLLWLAERLVSEISLRGKREETPTHSAKQAKGEQAKADKVN